MTFEEVAQSLVDGCRDNTSGDRLDLLYAPDAISVEAVDMGQGREAVGLDAIKAKHAWWDSEMEFLGGDIKGPMPHGADRFAVIFQAKIREKATGTVSDMEEVGIYTVKDGKIVREEFFYATGGA